MPIALPIDSLKIVTNIINSIQKDINTSPNPPGTSVETITGEYTVTQQQSGTIFLINANTTPLNIYLPPRTELTSGTTYKFILKNTITDIVNIVQQDPYPNTKGMIIRQNNNENYTYCDNIDNSSRLYFTEYANAGDYIEYTILPSEIISVFAFTGTTLGIQYDT